MVLLLKPALSVAPGRGLLFQVCHMDVPVAIGRGGGVLCVLFRWGILSLSPLLLGLTPCVPYKGQARRPGWVWKAGCHPVQEILER